MAFRLRNKNNPDQTLGITVETWYSILNLAEQFGWNPFHRTRQNPWDHQPPLAGTFNGSPLPIHNEIGDERFVQILLEDALNLADALERAFIGLEPVRVPTRFYFFHEQETEERLYPSIGAILEVVNFCKMGTFQIEPFRNGHPTNGKGDSGYW